MCAGARPEPLRPCSSPSSHSSAKASPPTPLWGGSQTVSMAAAASAASTALPPASSARTPARVASGWLVATIASAAIVGRRAHPDAPDAAANSRSFSIEGRTLAARRRGYRPPSLGSEAHSARFGGRDEDEGKPFATDRIEREPAPAGERLRT